VALRAALEADERRAGLVTNDLSRTLGPWFGDYAEPAPPSEPLARILETTRGMRPRPSAIARLGSHSVASAPTGSVLSGIGVLRPALIVALIALLTLALAVGALLIGSRLSLQTRHVYANEIVSAPDMTMVMTHPVVVPLLDGRVLVIGLGDDGGGRPTTGLVYDLTTESSTPVGRFALAQRWVTSAVRLGDGRVLIAGDAGAELFDPATLRFSRVGPMVTPRTDAQMAVLQDGRVLIVGGTPADGSPAGGPSDAIRSAELFDAQTLSFSATGSRVIGTSFSSGAVTTLPDGRVFIASDRVEIYDPSVGTFSAGEPTPDWVVNASIAMPDGRVTLLGSQGVGTRTGRGVVWDPTSQSYPLAFITPGFAITGGTLLDDGRIFMTGGQLLRWAGIYDPATNVADRINPPKAWWPTTVRLDDGRVLIVGGVVDGEVHDMETGGHMAPAVATVEIFQ
jgi:hypothetical protein